MEWVSDPQVWIAFVTLAALEIVLAFLLLIGVMLVVEGTGNHVPKGYIYFAMAFSLFVELLNMRAGSRVAKPVRLC